MMTYPHMDVLNSSAFMSHSEDAREARQQHISAAIEFELAEAALNQLMLFNADQNEELACARARWIEAMARLRDATVYYLQSLSDGLEDSPYDSLDDLIWGVEAD